MKLLPLSYTRRKMQQRQQQQRRQRGSVAVMVLLVLVAVTAIALAVASISLSAVRSARLAQDRITGLALAEAGIDEAIDKLTYNSLTSVVNGTLYTNEARTVPLGTYAVTITVIDAENGIKRAVSVGTNANGTTTRVIARLVQTKRVLGSAAMMSDGPINLGGGAKLLTTPLDHHVADIYSNGNVDLGGAGTVDGTLISAGTVTGTAFYPSVTNAPRLLFPDTATVNTMLSGYRAEAQAAGATYYSAKNLFSGGKTTVTITAPAFIDGDLSLQSSKHLVIQGDGVVYLNGSLTTNAYASITNGSTLIVGGAMNQNGQSTYSISPTTPPAATPTLAVANGSVTLNGGASNQLWGVIYAFNGPIMVNGNATFTGALISQGTGANISSTGTFDQYFPIDMASRIKIPSDPKVTQILEF